MKEKPSRRCAGMVIRLTVAAKVPVAQHLGYGNSYELARECMQEGYTSLMIDGSDLPYDRNVALTRRLVEMAREIPVETEMGTVGGDKNCWVIEGQVQAFGTTCGIKMGQGEELLIYDGNYPKFCYPERCVRIDGHGIPEILDAVLRFFRWIRRWNIRNLHGGTANAPCKPEIRPVYREIGVKHEKDGLREQTINKSK